MENYITGSVLRGAIAFQILQLSGRGSENLAGNGGNFQNLFLDESAAIFGNAYPAVAKINNQSIAVSDQIKVLPATLSPPVRLRCALKVSVKSSMRLAK